MSDNRPVLCIGDTDVDLFIEVATLPGFDQKIDGRVLARTPGGMAANVAVALARLGTPARLLSCIGDDADGRFAFGKLAEEGVDIGGVRTLAGARTFSCLVFLGPSGEKALVRLPTGAYLPDPAALDPRAFADVAHVHLTMGRPAVTLRAMALARAAGCTVSLDLEESDLPVEPAPVVEALAAADLVFVNERTHLTLEARCLGSARGDRPLVVTLGARGSRYVAAGASAHAPGLAVRPVDTTGAGDAFAAAFIHTHLLHGMPPAAALAFANTAAALGTRAIGAQTALPGRAEVEERLAAEWHDGKVP